MVKLIETKIVIDCDETSIIIIILEENDKTFKFIRHVNDVHHFF